MAELADAADLKSAGGKPHLGSSPSRGVLEYKMKNFKSALIIFAIASLASLTVGMYAIYEINQVKNDTSNMLDKFDYDIDRIKSQPIANLPAASE